VVEALIAVCSLVCALAQEEPLLLPLEADKSTYMVPAFIDKLKNSKIKLKILELTKSYVAITKKPK